MTALNSYDYCLIETASSDIDELSFAVAVREMEGEALPRAVLYSGHAVSPVLVIV